MWRITGDKRRGTRVAARMGQGFAVLLGGVGLWLLLSGGEPQLRRPVAARPGLLLGQSARAALVQSAFDERIEGVRVADIMDTHPVAIPAGTPVGQALDEYFLRYGWSWFPVIDDGGPLQGIARQERAQSSRRRAVRAG